MLLPHSQSGHQKHLGVMLANATSAVIILVRHGKVAHDWQKGDLNVAEFGSGEGEGQTGCPLEHREVEDLGSAMEKTMEPWSHGWKRGFELQSKSNDQYE